MVITSSYLRNIVTRCALLRGPHWALWLVAGCSFYVAGFFAWLLFGWGGESRVALAANIASIPLWAVITVVCIHRAATAPEQRSRQAWHLMMAAFAAYTAGELLWLGYEELLHQEPFPSWADLGYLAFYPLLAGGLFRFPVPRRGAAAQRDYWLDGAIVLLGGSIVLWLLVIHPVIDASSDGAFALALSVAYPVGDLVLLLGLANVLLRGLAQTGRLSLMGGILAFVVGDAGFARMSLTSSYTSGDWPDAAWVLAAWLIVVAVSPRVAVPATPASTTAEGGARPAGLLAYSAMALGFVTLALVAVQLQDGPLSGVMTAAVLLTGLGIARQVTVFRDNGRLMRRTVALLEELGRREARYRALVQHASDVIAVCDPHGLVRSVTPSARQMLGIAPEDCAGRPAGSFVHPRDLHAILKMLADLPSGGASVRLPARVLHVTGLWRTVEVTAVNLTDEPGVEGFVFTLHDITEQQAAERELRAAHSELEIRVQQRTAELSRANTQLEREIIERRRAEEAADAASRAKSEYLSRMSHELRTPLNAILGFAQLMEMDERSPEDAESVRLILAAGKHLLNMINEVLDISRIESGRLQMEWEAVPLAEVAQVAVEMVQPLAEQRGIHIVDELPAGTGAVRADQQRLRQVVINLLSNAIKYNREGGTVTLSVRGEGAAAGNETGSADGSADGEAERACPALLRLTVTDTGPGLTAAQQARLFTPFERLDADRTGVEGTGLGLALSYRLMEAMGGTLGVESSPGTGSSFWLTLPLAEPPVAEVAPLSAPAAPPQQRPAELSVLYVEDNPVNIKLMEAIAAMRPGVALRCVMLGSAALEAVRAQRPDLVLLDRQLPDMLGEEVLARLRAEPATAALPVVIVSADASPHQINALLAAGASAYLTKPFDVQQVFAHFDAAARPRAA